ncbi:MAG: transcriptional repressor [Cyclobacteriaceae bacterium]
MTDRVGEILRNYKLKKTSCRQDVLRLLLRGNHAMSHAELEAAVNENYDRVTLYRTLKTFQEKGLIHKVLDDDGAAKYAPCSDCTLGEHHHEHVHFKCNKCGNTVCIEDTNIPKIDLPEGFRIQERNLLISGICNKCNKI